MGLESATYISDLVATNPVDGDDIADSADHLRLIKAAVLASFPNVTGAVTPTHTELNALDGFGGLAIGSLEIPQQSKSAAYTLVLGDAGKHIYHPSTDANARTFTIPANASVAFPVGTAITFVNMTAEVVTVAITTDAMYLAGYGTTGSRSIARYGIATALKMTTTTWIISGSAMT